MTPTFADRMFPNAADDGADDGDSQSLLRSTDGDFDEAARNLNHEAHTAAEEQRTGVFGRLFPKIAGVEPR